MSGRRAKAPVLDKSQAELAFAAIPSLLEHYARECEQLWASGKNSFDVPGAAPCELRWLVYRKL